MKPPATPPTAHSLAEELLGQPEKMMEVFELSRTASSTLKEYIHWDKLRFLNPPEGFTTREWWLAIKAQREPDLKQIPLVSTNGKLFNYKIADPLPSRLHEIDLSVGGGIHMPYQITNPATKNQYYVESLIEEAITSSQLEGATTTRRVAEEMIRIGRRPIDRSEQMIFNNYHTMQAISELKNEPLTKELVLHLHSLITRDTLDDPNCAGRFRTKNELVAVMDDEGVVHHTPPDADELEARIKSMCDFANQKTPDEFLHPAVRAMILHFWLAYDHPFVDGNGRTARALFYWAMLKYGYWLCEYISISTIILKSPSKYARAFLYTETDDNDLTYFLLYHSNVLHRSIQALQAYIKRQVARVQEVESKIKTIAALNHRQIALINNALRHPKKRYTIVGHQTSHRVVYQTARTDLLEMVSLGLMDTVKVRRRIYFIPVPNLEKALADL